MLKYFRITGFLEGISFLVLMGIAMPMKYIYGEPMAVKMVGWIHGLLFMAYVVLLTQVATEKSWPVKKSFFGFIAAILPFGTFLFDRAYLQADNRDHQ